MRRKGIDEDEIKKRVNKSNQTFPDALVDNYEPLIDALALPDEDDRHVLAAAIKANVNLIVMNNLKDFPTDYLVGFGLTAKNADDFITDTIDLNNDVALHAFRTMVVSDKNSEKLGLKNDFKFEEPISLLPINTDDRDVFFKNIVKKWIRITYRDIGEKYTKRIIFNRSRIDFSQSGDDIILIEANCLLRDGAIRHFRLDRILAYEHLEGFDKLFVSETEK